MVAVKENGYALNYVSNELKNDKEVVLTAVNNYGRGIIHASEELRKDKKFMNEVIKIDSSLIKYKITDPICIIQ